MNAGHAAADAAAFDVFGCELRGTQLIEASAGTGKTWNLCALYLRLLLEHELTVADILVVTFTNAATAELRERVRARLAQTLARLRGGAAPGADGFVDTLLARLHGVAGRSSAQLIARLELALHGFDEAAIQTIHGFCQRALAEAPFVSGMPLQLELLADDEDLRLQAVHDFWRRHVAGAALSGALAAHLLHKQFTPQRLAELLARHLAKPCSVLRWPQALDAHDDTQVDLHDEAGGGAPGSADAPRAAAPLPSAYAAARALWQGERDAIAAIAFEALPRLPRNRYSEAALQRALQSWDTLLAAPTVPDTLAGLDKLELLGSQRLRSNKGLAPPGEHAFFAAAQRLLEQLDARTDALELQRLRLLRRFVHEAGAQLRRSKREQRVLGFDDMLANLHERLAAPQGAALARALRQRYKAALVDEFQDTDPLQYAILRAVYGGSDAPLFLVGDPKQAIYSFRHADLHTYLRARADARAEFTLAENQRSTADLLHALNALFSANPHAFMLDALHYRPVRCGAKPRTPLLEPATPARAALQLWQLPHDAEGQPLPRAEAKRASLQACAAEIARLLASGARLGDRPLAAGDIAVLVRSHAQGAAARAALSALGVGSVELSQASVYASSDAAELQCVLAAMLQPQREGLLRAALATEAMGLDAAALHALGDDEGALLDHMARFAGYRARWLADGVGRMLHEWLRAEGVAARLLARPDGERRLTNLRHLAECLHEAASEHGWLGAPESLLRWLQAQRRQARHDEAAQLRLESDRNLVQVVTIHKSKGLEYPLVFCPLLWDGWPSARRGGEGLEYHDAGGRGVIDFRSLDKPALAAVKQGLALQAAAEQLRLIYVALTRAVHRCTLVVGSYLAKVGGGEPSAAQSGRALLNWLVAGAGMTPEQWLKDGAPAQAIEQAWAALAREHAPQLRLQALPRQRGTAIAPQTLAAQRLAALPAPLPLPRAWWIGSYSALAQGARHEAAALDHDQRVDAADTADTAGATAPAAVAAPASVGEDDIADFPRGAAAGECLHALFEQADFSDDAAWGDAADAVLRRYAAALPGGDAALRRRMLLRLLRDVLHTPLPTAPRDGLPGDAVHEAQAASRSFRLAELPRQRRLVELEFHLRAPRLDAAALTRTLRRLGYAAPQYGFGSLHGYLRGFIDLVFEHGGRYHLLDWKSNHLGASAADYAPAALQQAMDQHGYTLQALLYALALHRHLGQRLAGYRHEQHFGGVYYLFVRGVRPGWTLPGGACAGVHLQRPPLQVLRALDALLDGRESAA